MHIFCQQKERERTVFLVFPFYTRIKCEEVLLFDVSSIIFWSSQHRNKQHRQTVTLHLPIYWGTTRLSFTRLMELEPSIYPYKNSLFNGLLEAVQHDMFAIDWGFRRCLKLIQRTAFHEKRQKTEKQPNVNDIWIIENLKCFFRNYIFEV